MASNPTSLPSTSALSSQQRDRLSLRYILSDRFSRISRIIVQLLTQGNEPKISQYVYPDGHTVWTVYHPRSNQRTVCASEAEVRFWLEQQYNWY
ncbi:MAG: hypothetical protein IGS54_06415 [Elainella sp. C42_A2020_010]|nr:hypothetical protein [Elainella sp. C42_A2020_010]